jgi:chromosome segregation ATPase
MEKYYQKLRKYQTKLSSAQNLAKQKLYQIKINQYNSMLNLTGGNKEDATELKNKIDSNLGDKLPKAIADILEEAKGAADLIKKTYTEDSVNNMLEEIKNQVTFAKESFSNKLKKLKEQIDKLTKEISALKKQKEEIESGNCKNDNELREKIKQLEEEIASMKRDIDEKDAEIQKLKDELKEAQNKGAASNEENNDLKEIIDSLEKHVNDLTTQLDVLLKAVQNIKSSGPKDLDNNDENIKEILNQLDQIRTIE